MSKVVKEFQCFEQRPLVGERNVSFSDEGPLLETLEFFEINHGSYQPLNFLPYLTLSLQYCILISIHSSIYRLRNFRLDFT